MTDDVQIQLEETPPCLIPARAFSAYGYDVTVYKAPTGEPFDVSGWAAEIETQSGQSFHDRLGPFSSAGEAVLFALDWCREHQQDHPFPEESLPPADIDDPSPF